MKKKIDKDSKQGYRVKRLNEGNLTRHPVKRTEKKWFPKDLLLGSNGPDRRIFVTVRECIYELFFLLIDGCRFTVQKRLHFLLFFLQQTLRNFSLILFRCNEKSKSCLLF